MATSSSAIFSGNSRYSSDFQALIDRAVAIASLPIQQMNSTKSALSAESSALQGLDSQLGSLQNAVTAIGQAESAGSYQVSTSTADVGATLGAGASLGSYSITVDTLGAYTTAMSNNGLPTVADPTQSSISTSASFTLTVNNSTYSINPSSNTLSALADAINSSGAPLSATVVNVGSSSAPDYRLSLQGTKLNSDQIQLNDGTRDLLNTLVAGAPATYQVDGLSTVLQSDSRTVTLAPGLDVELNARTGAEGPTIITVERDSGGLQNALSSFVNAYNAVVGTLNQQHGQTAGPLAGDSILGVTYDALRQMVSATGTSGSIQSLADLGISLNEDGTLSLDASALAAANPSDVAAFLGSATTSGFLKTAGDALTSLEDPTSGAVKQELSSLQDQMNYQDQQISTTQDRVDQMQQSLQQRMSAADALIASMEQQVNYLSGLFQAMQYNQKMIGG